MNGFYQANGNSHCPLYFLVLIPVKLCVNISTVVRKASSRIAKKIAKRIRKLAMLRYGMCGQQLWWMGPVWGARNISAV